MNAAVDPGALRIDVEVDAAGRVTSTAMHSRRPVGLARLFVGRPAHEIPPLATRLFSLCGYSHGVAARFAIDAARGDAGAQAIARIWLGLAAEQFSESLRAAALGWPRDDAAPSLAEIAVTLREAMGDARSLMKAAQSAEPVDSTEIAAALDRLLARSEALGLRSDNPVSSPPDRFFAKMMSEARFAAFGRRQAPDALLPEDDAVVVAALRKGGAIFAAAPTLPGRIVETGAYARHWREAPAADGNLAARLGARLIAIRQALDAMQRALAGVPDVDDVAASGAVGDGEGFAAVETARGRLYHWVRLDAAGCIAQYEILAPTEWNFHFAGPFVAALSGAEVGLGAAARLNVARLAALFDPCVAFRIELRDLAHA